MPLVKTEVSYENEGELGRREASTFQREVEDLDIYDWLFYMMKQTEMMGYDVAQIQLITSKGTIYKTDL